MMTPEPINGNGDDLAKRVHIQGSDIETIYARLGDVQDSLDGIHSLLTEMGSRQALVELSLAKIAKALGVL